MQEHEDLARYERLIYKVSHKTLRRLLAVGARSVSLEDVAQEYRFAWLIASRAYDPERGVPWMPYLINGLRKHTFTVLRRYTFKLQAEQYAVSIWEKLETEDGRGEVQEALIEGPSEDPLAQITQKEMLQRAMRKLSPRAAQFLQILANPPEEITEEILRLRDKAEFGRSLGLRSGANMNLTASMIFDLMDADRGERLLVIRELKTLGEKTCQRT